MSGDENDRNVNIVPDQFRLEIEAAHTRKPDVQDQAARRLGKRCLEELRCRIEIARRASRPIAVDCRATRAPTKHAGRSAEPSRSTHMKQIKQLTRYLIAGGVGAVQGA